MSTKSPLPTLGRQIGQYKKQSILTPVCAALEVFMEVLIPYAAAGIIDKGITAGSIGQVCLYGLLMIVLAGASMFFGVMAGRFAATASAGFAANLRRAMFTNIQTFSFSNIDKFSTAGLVTRMTTDVSNLQNAFQMCMRIAVRASLTMISSMIMCFFINGRIALVFLAAVLALACALFFIIRKVSKLFSQVFEK